MKVLGLGTSHLCEVQVDDHMRMDLGHLAECLQDAFSGRVPVLAVIGIPLGWRNRRERAIPARRLRCCIMILRIVFERDQRREIPEGAVGLEPKRRRRFHDTGRDRQGTGAALADR